MKLDNSALKIDLEDLGYVWRPNETNKPARKSQIIQNTLRPNEKHISQVSWVYIYIYIYGIK